MTVLVESSQQHPQERSFSLVAPSARRFALSFDVAPFSRRRPDEGPSAVEAPELSAEVEGAAASEEDDPVGIGGGAAVEEEGDAWLRSAMAAPVR